MQESASTSSPASTDSPWVRFARGTRTDFPQSTLPEIFGDWVAASPDAIAVIDGEHRCSYRELDEWSELFAGEMRRLSLPVGFRIGVPAIRSAKFVAAILGVLKAGGAYLPLDLDEPEARLRLRLKDCQARLIWNSAEHESRAFEVHLSERAVVPSSEFSGSVTETPAYVLYTSGSTGQPKGVLVPHTAIVRLVCRTDYLQLSSEDRFALHSNLSFDASTLELWGPLLNGGSLVVTPRETLLSAELLKAHLEREGVTSLWLTTSLFAQLAQQSPGMFGGLRHLIFGGEAADVAAIRRVWQAGRPEHLINGYGPTESTTFAVCHQIRGDEGDRIPIGRPIANTDAWVLDERGEPAQEGELWIGGPGVALGYLNEPELTARSFVEHPLGRLYRTGDRARWRDDGTLDFLGRRDRQIKIRGFRIEPGEVEAAILRFPGVRQCAVRTVPAQGEGGLAAFVAGEAVAHELRAFLQRELPAHMVPAAYASLEALPLTVNGKLDESALPKPQVPHLTSPRPVEGTSLQREIATVWGRVLGIENIGLDENFFDLGGTSLSLLRLHAELRQHALGGALRIVALFEHPTVRKLCAFLEGSLAATRPVSLAAERAARRRRALGRRSAT